MEITDRGIDRIDRTSPVDIGDQLRSSLTAASVEWPPLRRTP